MIGPGGKSGPYGDMHLHENAVATVINTVDKPHLVQGLFMPTLLKRFIYTAGSTGAITDTVDNGSGKLRITSAAHGLSTGAVLSTTGLTTTAQNEVTNVTVIDPATFDCDDISFVTGSETGIWYEGDKLTAMQGASGTYKAEFNAHGVSALSNKIFSFGFYKNAVWQDNVEAKRKFASIDIGPMAGGGIIEVTEGDIMTFAIFNNTDTTNFTIEHASLVLHKI